MSEHDLRTIIIVLVVIAWLFGGVFRAVRRAIGAVSRASSAPEAPAPAPPQPAVAAPPRFAYQQYGPPPAPPPPRPVAPRPVAAAPQRIVAAARPAARLAVPPAPSLQTITEPALTPAPVSATRRMLIGAFADPAHARNAVILSEVLGRPISLR